MSEILGTLFKYLLALLAITAVVVVLYEALGSSKVSDAISDVTTMQTNITQLASGSDGATLTEAQLISAGAIPSSMVITTGTGSSASATISGPWGGTVLFPTAAAGMVGVTIPQVPSKDCIKMVMSLAPAMQEVDVGGTPVSGSGGTTSSTTAVSLSLSTVTTACTAAASEPVTVYFPANITVSST